MYDGQAPFSYFIKNVDYIICIFVYFQISKVTITCFPAQKYSVYELKIHKK